MTNVFNPRDMAELTACLPQLEPGAVIAGGCTDLSVRFLKEPLPGQILNVTLVQGIKGIFTEGGCLHLGAAATLSELEETELPEGFSALKQAASSIGSKQIRSMATIGGNVMNASPASDLLPCLFMFGAAAEFMKPDGSLHERPIGDLVIGAGKTSLAYNEVLTAVKLPLARESGWRSAFVKLGFRKRVTVSRIGIAVSALETGGRVCGVRFIMGAVAPVPVRVPEAEKILLENSWDDNTADALAAYLADLLNRTVPAEFDRDYKVSAVRGAAHDVLRMFPFFKEAGAKSP